MTPADFRGMVFGGLGRSGENKIQPIDFEVFYVSSIQLLPPKRLPPVYFLAGTVKMFGMRVGLIESRSAAPANAAFAF